jgi:hypothetical protein
MRRQANYVDGHTFKTPKMFDELDPREITTLARIVVTSAAPIGIEASEVRTVVWAAWLLFVATRNHEAIPASSAARAG